MISKKIAFIGTPDTILPFIAVGAEGFEAHGVEEAKEKLIDLLKKKAFGIIYIEEVFATDFSDEIRELNEKYRGVSITSIAGSRGGDGESVEKIRNLVKKAIGIDIFTDKGGKQ